MSILVLIHGAEMGSWMWEKVIPYLESLGHQVVTFDLPGSYENTCSLENIRLASYVSRTVYVIQSLAKPVFLVGHSFGGMVISQVGELIPDRIQGLIYLSAFLPMNGQCAMELVQLDTDGAHRYANEFLDEHMCRTKAETIEEIYLSDCTAEIIQWGITNCRPQAFKVMMDSTKLSKERFGKLKKIYISCLQDRCISPIVQKLMYTRTPCDDIFTLQAGHMPSLSIPGRLADLLGTIVEKYEVQKV
ncbi:hypothetical protein K7432_013075 [Basidiobolus ranarum]|uniref:AB hydrolase-1 domain-containing protein n=1 Tax=Basidiobolus ranarum TaxID=34480 RepID=A0ABR2VRB1_9FUNG